MTTAGRRSTIAWKRSARAQGFLGPLAVVNIDGHAAPFDDLSGGVGHRTSTEEEPAIRPIDTSQACFHFTWLANSHNGAPAFTQLG